MTQVFVVVVSDSYGDSMDIDCIFSDRQKADNRVKELLSTLRNVDVYIEEREVQ